MSKEILTLDGNDYIIDSIQVPTKYNKDNLIIWLDKEEKITTVRKEVNCIEAFFKTPSSEYASDIYFRIYFAKEAILRLAARINEIESAEETTEEYKPTLPF